MSTLYTLIYKNEISHQSKVNSNNFFYLYSFCLHTLLLRNNCIVCPISIVSSKEKAFLDFVFYLIYSTWGLLSLSKTSYSTLRNVWKLYQTKVWSYWRTVVNLFLYHQYLHCRNMKLEKEIFPAATDSRFIRAVSTDITEKKNRRKSNQSVFSYMTLLGKAVPFLQFCARSKVCLLRLGGYPCHWLFPNEPDANPVAWSQRVPKWASLPERHQCIWEAHLSSCQRSCLSWWGLGKT